MGAYAMHSPFVTKKIVSQASQEILAIDAPAKPNYWKWLPLPLSALLIIVCAFVYMNWNDTATTAVDTKEVVESSQN